MELYTLIMLGGGFILGCLATIGYYRFHRTLPPTPPPRSMAIRMSAPEWQRPSHMVTVVTKPWTASEDSTDEPTRLDAARAVREGSERRAEARRANKRICDNALLYMRPRGEGRG